MPLSGQQRKQLRKALLDAFPEKQKLKQMLSDELDKTLEILAGDGNLEDIIFQIIETAESQGWTNDLFQAARKSNPGNAELQAIDFIFDIKKFKEEFKNALFELNYTTQKSLFEDILNLRKPAISFFIFGESDDGQWLVNLLTYKKFQYASKKQISIVIKRHRNDANMLLKNLAEEFGITSASDDVDSLIESFVEAVYKQLRFSTVILVIYNINYITRGLQQFLKLWQCLVEKINQGNDTCSRSDRIYNKLVLFLIHNTELKPELDKSLSLLWNPDEYKSKPHIPLALQKVEPLNQEVVIEWVSLNSELLLKHWKNSESIQEVMRRKVPEDNPLKPICVFEEICSCFNLKWDEIEKELAL